MKLGVAWWCHMSWRGAGPEIGVSGGDTERGGGSTKQWSRCSNQSCQGERGKYGESSNGLEDIAGDVSGGRAGGCRRGVLELETKARVFAENVAQRSSDTPVESARFSSPISGVLQTLYTAPMPGPTQTLSPNGENNNDIIQDNGTIIPFRKHTVRGERSYRLIFLSPYGLVVVRKLHAKETFAQ
ncbi:microtubule-associated RP EB family member 2 isoform X1 [Pelobates cultripes]|uniref:Microtubule-associated RP EB family member 2 isoform X1 n=1 Tax=Pelobates cultripes TaxID=61616 RepID=A0AAD1W1S8_PELCU|nr:microtubule-associated RP EB family member 2 isoform X1 [Pelobates cultripes]